MTTFQRLCRVQIKLIPEDRDEDGESLESAYRSVTILSVEEDSFEYRVLYVRK